MDYRNNFENDKSLIVYGHYKVQTYTYEIFSVYTADLINRDYLSIHFNSNYEFKDYLNYIT